LIRKGKKRGRRIGPLSDESEDSGDFPELKAGPPKPSVISSSNETASIPAAVQTTIVGSALARDASGNVITPKVAKRRKKTKTEVTTF
jgi:hypothetical protein